MSLSGAALGVLLAYRTVALIVTLLPEFSFPHEAAIRINLPVLCFSVALAIFTGVFFGLSPAVQLSRPEVSQVMQASTKKVTGGVRGKRTHNVLIAGQIALTLLLLASAGAAIQGFLRLNHLPSRLQPAQCDVGRHTGARQHLHSRGRSDPPTSTNCCRK